jgi:hypothetical protein
MRKLHDSVGYPTVNRALRYSAIRLQATPETGGLAAEIAAERTRLGGAQDAYEQLREQRVGRIRNAPVLDRLPLFIVEPATEQKQRAACQTHIDKPPPKLFHTESPCSSFHASPLITLPKVRPNFRKGCSYDFSVYFKTDGERERYHVTDHRPAKGGTITSSRAGSWRSVRRSSPQRTRSSS